MLIAWFSRIPVVERYGIHMRGVNCGRARQLLTYWNLAPHGEHSRICARHEWSLPLVGQVPPGCGLSLLRFASEEPVAPSEARGDLEASPSICVRHASSHFGLGIIAAAGGGPMRPSGLSTAFAITLLTAFPAALAGAQWLNYPTPGTPRLADGTPNLSAPAPRTADGKPDLSGVWRGAGPF